MSEENRLLQVLMAPGREAAERLGHPPSFDEWEPLILVCSSLEYVIEDEDRPGAPAIPAPSGLLGEPQGAAGAAPFTSPRSRLGADIASQASVESVAELEGSPFEPASLRLCRLMPGVHNLGASRSERIATLKTLLRDLPAYEWLQAQEPYRDTLSAMRGRLSKLSPEYGIDTAEFLLIAAIAAPLRSYHFTEIHAAGRYPSKPEVRAALDAAELLRNFFKTYGLTLLVDGRNTGAGSSEASALAEALRALHDKGNYEQPKKQEIELQRAILGQFGLGLRKQFGSVSPLILSTLALLIGGYKITSNNATTLMQELEGAEPKRREAKAPPPAPVAGLFGGLGVLHGKWGKNHPQKGSGNPDGDDGE